MKTDTLAKLYPYLTPWERLPLIVAAAARNDEPERRRLLDSAPTVGLQLPNYFGLAQALRETVELHSLTVLDLATSFWQWWGLRGWHQYAEGVAGQSPGRAGNHPCKGKSKTKADADEAFRLYCMVRYHAFLFVTHVDGWNAPQRVNPYSR